MNNKLIKSKQFFLLFLAIVSGIICQAQTNFAQTTDERITRALAEINKADLAGAQADLNEVFKAQPNNATAFYLRGLIDFKQSNFDQAIADQSKAIELDPNPNFVEFYYERGLAYQYKPTPDYKAAFADFSHALQVVPTYKAAYVERGWANFRMQNWAAAAGDYTQAIKLGAGTKEVYINRGAASLNAKDYDQAIADNRKALEIDPSNPTAKANLEMALKLQAQAPARSDMDALSATELLKRAAEAKKSGDTAAQERYVTAAIKADPKNYDAYEQRLLIYDAAGNKDAAIADCRQMIVIDPSNLDGDYLCANLYKDKKDYANAIPHYTALLNLKLTPRQTAQTYFDRGIAYHKIYEYDKAVADFSRALELQPDIKTALGERGEIYALQGYYDLAETDLQKLLALDPANKLATEDLDLVKEAKKANFNTGKIKEDTLLKFDEYSDRVMTETEIYTKKLGLITVAANQNPNDTAKICSAVGETDAALKIIEVNTNKINELLTGGKFDKLLSLKTAAQQLAGLFPDNRASLNKDVAKYGCRLN